MLTRLNPNVFNSANFSFENELGAPSKLHSALSAIENVLQSLAIIDES